MITYNQEKYVADALQSILSQDYDDLEVVISDDNSSDRTYEIISNIVAEYKGPFRIILNRNPVNLGIGANFHKAYTLSSGDWLFMAAGDDVSYAERCRIAETAIQDNPGSLCFAAYREIIDGDGKSCGYDTWNHVVHGAAAIWNRKLFSDFLPIPSSIMSEDYLLYFRALLLGGGVTEIEKATIKYRIDGHTVSNAATTGYFPQKQYYLKKISCYKEILNVVELDMSNRSDLPDGFAANIARQKRLTDNLIEEVSTDLQIRDITCRKLLRYLKSAASLKQLGHRCKVVLMSMKKNKKSSANNPGAGYLRELPPKTNSTGYRTYSVDEYLKMNSSGLLP